MLCLIVLIANGLRADIYEAIKVSSNGYVTTTYNYGHQGSLRLWQTSNFRNHHIIIWNEEHHTAYELDPNAHEYREAPKTDSIALFAKWIAHRMFVSRAELLTSITKLSILVSVAKF